MMGPVVTVVLLMALPAMPPRPALPQGPALGTSSGTASDGYLLTPGNDFPMYLGNVERTSAVAADPLINDSTAPSLHQQWSFDANGWQVESQPIEQNGIVYVGGKSGYEYALDATNGSLLWKTFLGQDANDTGCGSNFQFGVTSTATADGSTIYVDGGWPNLYALNATTGAVEWQSPIGGSANVGYYDWSSPLIYDGDAYIGTASACVTPLVAAGIAEYSLSTHAVVAYLNTSAPAVNGSSIWGSPAINPETNTVFVATGDPPTYKQTNLSESLLALNATTLAVRASWQIPPADVIADGDFGVTPTLFTPPGGVPMVTAADKNGILYALDQSNLTLVWKHRLCCGNSVVVERDSTSWGGGLLYALGDNVTINGQVYNSTVTAFEPLTGAIAWQRTFNFTAEYGYSAPLYVNGLLLVADQGALMVLNATTGATLYQDVLPGVFQSGPSIARGEIFAGSSDFDVYAFTLQLNATVSARALSGFGQSFSVAATGGLPPYSFGWTFGDAATSTLENPSHTYAGPGTYHVNVTVTDLAGNVSTYALVVVVQVTGLTPVDFAAVGLAVVGTAGAAVFVVLYRRSRRSA